MTRAIPLKRVEDDGALYRSAPKIHPGEVDGPLQRLRALAVFVLLGLFYAMPWVGWDGRQAVLFDLPARKFHVLGLVLWPQDFPYLAALLAIAGLSLFFFTALAGRLWCGYACPQTVWTEVFLWIERAIEGRRNQRLKLDGAPWTPAKLVRKGAKHAAWIAFAAWTGFTFVGFFTPIRTLAAEIATLSVGSWEAFWMLFYGFATYGNAGWLREQVCTYMCPYARFQSAMLDRDSLVIAYDAKRGEPRGRGKKRDSGPSALQALATQAGDCVDCSVCVQVCPTGIDIRDGLQFECIGCGACIDGCNGVMDKLGRPRGLVRYTTQNALDGARQRIVRPRVAVYLGLLLAIAGGTVWSVARREPLLVDVLRDRNALYRVAGDGRTENAYTLKLVNRDGAAHTYRVAVASGVPLALRGVGPEVEVPAGAVATVVVTLHADEGVRGRHDVVFRVADRDDAGVAREERSSFFAPVSP